jgi:perosamine synthetase
MNIHRIILGGIKKVVKKKSKKLHEPLLVKNEKKYLSKCIETNYVSYKGKFVEKFEKKLIKYTKSKYAVAVINGTSALHIILKIFKINSLHEVILPTLSFVAVANAIKYCNATPNFVDSEISTLGLDPIKLKKYLIKNTVIKNKQCINKKTGKIIKALIAVHVFGMPCKILELKKICKEFHLLLIEDAAEAIGSFYKGKHLGLFGDASILSFNGNKTITTGGGGAILTNNRNFANIAKHLTTTAKMKHKWEYIHDKIAYNYRMPNINAAVGCAQLENIDRIIKAKRRNFLSYKKIFKSEKNFFLLSESINSKVNYWLITIILKKPDFKTRNSILRYINSKGYEARPIWRPLHKLSIFKGAPRDNLSTSEKIYKSTLNIPSSPILSY